MSERQGKPDVSTIIAWVGIIGTILGIIGFFISDLPGLFRHEPEGLTEEQIVATLVALQNDKQQAELQLTRIALENIQAANQSTQQAIDRQLADSEATLHAVQEVQAAFIATQNAIAALTATSEAAQAAMTATATALNATETQAAMNATATADFLAQITPTPTQTLTPTPLPTATPTPAPVVDFRSLLAADVRLDDDGMLLFAVQAAQDIPEQPPNGLAYVWLVDTDRSPDTGYPVQDIGAEMRIAVRFDENSWIGRVSSLDEEEQRGDPLFFLANNILIDGAILAASISPADFGLPTTFDWVVRAELEGETYSLLPEIGHNTLGG